MFWCISQSVVLDQNEETTVLVYAAIHDQHDSHQAGSSLLPMAKATTKKKGKKNQVVEWVPCSSYSCVLLLRSPTRVSSARPRWRVLPPEIIRMILHYLADDKPTLRACSQTAHDLRHTALSFLGRHLTVNTVDRLKECTPLIAKGAFQHVRSLDLGINNKRVILEEYWKAYLVILKAFAQYRILNRLWLSEVPFNFVRPGQKKTLRETVTALGSTVTELGLYGCHFSSYEEMISLIRSFPLCNFLFIRDCVSGEQAAGGNALAGLPEHKLSIKDLQLSASSSNDLLIDVSNLIEDATLDVGSLTSLVCDVGTSEKTQRIATAVSTSPMEQFQVACVESEGFQGMRAPLSSQRCLVLTPC